MQQSLYAGKHGPLGHTVRDFTSESEIRKDRFEGHHLGQELVERVDLDLCGGYNQFSSLTFEDMTYLDECISWSVRFFLFVQGQ